MRARQLDRGSQLLFGLDVERYAASVISVERLARQGKMQRLQKWQGLRDVANDAAGRHRNAGVAEQLLGELFVAGDIRSDRRCPSRDARADAHLLAPVTQLHEAVVVEAQDWDLAIVRLGNQGLRRRS